MTEEAIVLNIFSTEMHARMARDVLQDEGVTAFVFKDDAATEVENSRRAYDGRSIRDGVRPDPAGTFGCSTGVVRQRSAGVSLIVNRTDADRARQILRPLTSF